MMAGKRRFTDEELKFILSFKRTNVKVIVAECAKKWPERGISESNVGSIKSHYFIDAEGNVQSQHLHQRSMRDEHDRSRERIASMIKAKQEADEAEIQEFAKAWFEKYQKAGRETEQSLGLPKCPSNANNQPKAATSALINEAEKQGQVDSACSEGTTELRPTQVSQSPTLLSSHTSAVQSTSPIQVSTEGARMSTSNLSQTTAFSSTKLKPSLGPLNPESNISLTSMASNRATNSDDTEYPTFYDYAGSEIIEFRVGHKRKSFKIHKKLLVAKSKYIRVDPVVYLPFRDPDAFAFIFEWFYRQNITAFPELTSGRARTPAHEGTPQFIRHSKAISNLIKVYSLALLWEMPELSDLVMNQLGRFYFWTQTQRWPSQEEFRAAYQQTRPDCGLRKLMARSYNYILLKYDDNSISLGDLSTTKELVGLAEKIPSLKEDSFNGLRGLMSDGSTRLLYPGYDKVCDYHAHGQQEACRFKGISFRDVTL